jgi:hypothetical protein
MRLRLVGIGIVLVVLFAARLRAAEPVNCPDRIEVKQQLAKPLPGWTAVADQRPHPLAGITFYDGPPEEKASLVYDKITKSAGKDIAVWHFNMQGGRQVWLSCNYADTAIVLKRGLDRSISICAVTYDSRTRVAGLPAIEKIACK